MGRVGRITFDEDGGVVNVVRKRVLISIAPV